jgi:coenzyme F420-reducing hydrogenase delta subunit
MWIRNQNEDILLNLDCITALKHSNLFGDSGDNGPCHALIACGCGNRGCEFELGRYHTAKRVSQIMEEIEDEIMEDSSTVYYMPLE